jgi:hypothetical protein
MGKKRATSDPDIQIIDEDQDDDGMGDDTSTTHASEESEDRGDEVTPREKPLDPKAVQKVAAEADDEDDDTDDAPPKPKPQIPKERFDEVNETLKEVRRQNEILLAALQQRGGAPAAEPAPKEEAKAVDLDALEDAYANAMMDGDMAKAKQIRGQIRAEERRLAKEEALEEFSAAEERKLFDAQVKTAYAAYPQLDHKAAGADAEAIAEVIEWRNFLVASKGAPLHIALRDAVDRVASARGWEKPDGAGKAQKDPPSDRAEAQRRKNADAANAQPAQLSGGVGERAGRARQLDVEKMSDKEFAALSEEEKKQLRGDVA